jgi:hypothetical protein
MPYFTLTQRAKIALGGVISASGFLLLTLTFLSLSGELDPNEILGRNMLMVLITVIGVLDIISGLALLRSR